MWYVVALVWIALVAGIFWAYGRRRQRAAGARERELAALVAEARADSRAVAAAVAPAGVPAAAVRPLAAAPSVRARTRLLGAGESLLYLLFRTGLPDHEIFANLTLADIVEPAPALAGFEREQWARRLAQHRLALVVCTRQLDIVAVVPAAVAGDEATAFVAATLASAGVRSVRVDPASPPRHAQVRALVYGEPAPQ